MEQPKRKQIRLKDYDYSQEGFYFVTLCTQNRQRIFDIEPSAVGNDLCVVPSLQNQIVHKWIRQTENKFTNIKIDKFVIMPNHIHLLVNITERHIGRSLQDLIENCGKNLTTTTLYEAKRIIKKFGNI